MIHKSPFGRTSDGQMVDMYTISNSALMTVKLITYGARVTEIHVPDRQGNAGNVVLGFDNVQQYLADRSYLGATIGRFANRIAKAQFTLDGRTFKLPPNEPPNTLHGGASGFDKVVWEARPSQGEDCVTLGYFSPDGDNGFPGNCRVQVTFRVTPGNELSIEYTATTDKPTPVNLTNHSYFNLAGPGSGDVLKHLLTIRAPQYTPVDDEKIPTGEIRQIEATPMDFTAPRVIGAQMAQMHGGYDLNYVLRPDLGIRQPCAALQESESGRLLEMFTTEPGLQFYSGNFLDGSVRGIGGAYRKYGALCLEAQHFPDSVHHPSFPTTILRPGQTYRQTTIYRFSTI